MSINNQSLLSSIIDSSVKSLTFGGIMDEESSLAFKEGDQSIAFWGTTSSSLLSPSAPAFSPFSAAGLAAGPAPFNCSSSIDPPKCALGALVPRRPDRIPDPVYVKNTFLEAGRSESCFLL